MASREEQETTVTGNRKEGIYYIWTADPVHIRKFDKAVDDGRATVRHRGEDWAEFVIAATYYDPARGLKRPYALSEEQREARASRLRLNRENANNSSAV